MELPTISDPPELSCRKMTLKEYAEFSLICLKNNPMITAENCMSVRLSDTKLKTPFELKRDSTP